MWLPTAAEMAALDDGAIASGAATERSLIETAGREMARVVAGRWPGRRAVALAGGGHNGADAVVAARTLRAWGGKGIAVLGPGVAAGPEVLAGWELPVFPASRLEEVAGPEDVLLDGLLGTGLSGPPRPPQAELIRKVNALGAPIVAVDGPSGADFSTGAVPGACIVADVTVCLGWPKLGLLHPPARSRCGELLVVEIGFPPAEPMGARAITAAWVRRLLPLRSYGSHKGDAGYLTLVAGAAGMAGAAVLAARAAVRGGAGIVRVVSDPGNRDILQASVPSAIFVSWDDDGAVRDAVEWAHALAVGPGLGTEPGRRALVARLLESRNAKPLLLDADAINIWRGDLRELAERLTPACLLTPHPGEAARLLGESVESIQADRPGVARRAAADLGCAFLLKGAPSLVAAAGEPLRVSPQWGGAVASGGSGDVLTGLAGAYLAAGLSAPDAAAAALFVSGTAAQWCGGSAGVAAADLPDLFPSVHDALASHGGRSVGPVLFHAPAVPAPRVEGVAAV